MHKPWRRAVRLERAALVAYAEAYDRPTTLGGWQKGSDLVTKAEKYNDASWDRFIDLEKESATADQIEDTARLMDRLDGKWRGE